jgi:cell division protein FtsL
MLLPITNRDRKIIYRGIISLADDLLYVCQLRTYKVRNEIETKRNEINKNETKRNETK